MTDIFTWKANYNDETSLSQYTGNTTNKYPDIDRSKLVSFEILKYNKPFFMLYLEDDRRLIYRRRCFMNMMTKETHSVLIVGWQKTVGGENVQSINYLFEDGRIESHGSWKEQAMYSQPNLIEVEK